MRVSKNIHGFFWESMTQNNCNTYLIDGPTRILIDPGHIDLFDHVRSGLDELGLSMEDIGLVICTHAHPDHIEAVRLFKDTPARFAMGQAEWEWLKSMEQHIKTQLGTPLSAYTPEILIQEGQLSVGDLQFEMFHTPGHSPGSICIYYPENHALFTGDLVFREGIGRTDLPGGDGRLIKESIKRVSKLDAHLLLSGHGEAVSGADAVRRNFDNVESFWFAYV